MKQAKLISFYYVLISLVMSACPALFFGTLVYFFDEFWGLFTGAMAFLYVFNELIIRRKGNWLS